MIQNEKQNLRKSVLGKNIFQSNPLFETNFIYFTGISYKLYNTKAEYHWINC